MTNMEPNKGEIVMYQPDETIRLEVRVENETVWLTQQQMAELFNATKQNISLHINNIYDEGELEQIATVWYKKKNREISWKLKKTSYLCTVDQNKQHLSDKRRKKLFNI